VVEGGGWSAPRRGRFTLGKNPAPIVQEHECASEPAWTGAENLASTRLRSPDSQARSEFIVCDLHLILGL
jgi:hypothetical protein